jgi:DNA-binding beta-propeller fold protein YncE
MTSWLKLFWTTLTILGFAATLPAPVGAQCPAYLTQWGSLGSGSGQFQDASGVATDVAGNVYVADTGNHRIQVFEADGAFVRQFPVFGWKDFYTEPYLAAGPSDSVFATDSWKSRFASYDASGSIQRSFKADGLKSPTGIVIDPFGRILVSDRANDRIYAWSLTDLMK